MHHVCVLTLLLSNPRQTAEGGSAVAQQAPTLWLASEGTTVVQCRPKSSLTVLHGQAPSLRQYIYLLKGPIEVLASLLQRMQA
jgi:hypothetical protein